jgi:hypothetical protein
VAPPELAIHLDEPFASVAARGRFIAGRVAAATLPLRVRWDVKQKPILGVAGELGGWWWANAKPQASSVASDILRGDYRRPAPTPMIRCSAYSPCLFSCRKFVCQPAMQA